MRRLLLIFPFIFTPLQGEIWDRVQIEDAITRQIQRNLSLVLPREKYLVFTSVQIKKSRTREIDETIRRDYKRSSEQPPPSPPPPPSDDFSGLDVDILPGFSEFASISPEDLSPSPPSPSLQGGSQAEEQQYVQEKYSYVDMTTLDRVNISVVLDKSIPEDKIASIEDSLREKIRASYGAKGRVSFQTAELDVKKTWMDYVRENATPLIWILLLNLFFIFLLLFFLVLSRLLRAPAPSPLPASPVSPPLPPPSPPIEKEEKPPPLAPPPPPRPPKKQKKKTGIPPGVIEEQFITDFMKEPLISRKFFNDLLPDNKAKLAHSFDSDSLLSIFRRLDPNLLRKITDFDNLNEQELKQKKQGLIEKNLRALRQYRKMAHLQLTNEFGKITLLTKREIEDLFNQMDSRDAVEILKFVDKDVSRQYIKSLDEEKREELLDLLRKALSPSESSSERLGQLTEKFGEQIDNISRNIFVNSATGDDLSGIAIETSKNRKEILLKMKETNPELYDRYKKYTLDAKDLAEERNNQISQILGDIENETIAFASFAMPPELRDKVTQAISSDRNEYVQGIINANRGTIQKEESEKALEDIINVYRDYKTNKGEI